ncbi:MAG: hypothetical protein AAFV72_06390 [Cyanobacteria bacterium J06635_1]
MKRLLKKTFRQYFSTPAPRHRVGNRGRLSRRLSICVSALTAATLGVLGQPRVARALFVYETDLSNYTPNSLNENIAFPGTPASIQFDWTGATDTFGVLEPTSIENPDDPLTLSGGFSQGSPLNIQFDPNNPGDSVNLNISFLNGNTPAPIERLRLIVIDVDRDGSNSWQDQVFLGGDAPTPLITPATQASPPFQVSPEAEAQIIDPISIEDAGGPGLATPPANYTVDIAGTTLTGVYAPPDTYPLNNGDTVNILGTPTEQNPNAGSPVGVGNPLPDLVEGNNQSPEGTITADFGATPGQPVNNVTLSFGNGPASPANPAQHGIGLYTIVFTPGVIGTGKSVSEPTPGPNGTVNVTYTIRVENFGEVTNLNDVQVTDNLAETFEGTAGFTVSNVRAGGGGGVDLTVNEDFDGVNTQTLLADNQSLAPGAFTLIQYDVNINPAVTGLGPFENTAIGTAVTPVGLPISDRSADDTDPGPDGPNPDPNNDGDPLEDIPTPLDLTDIPVPVPAIGVTERVVSSIPTPGGAFGDDTVRVVYEIAVENIGPETLNNVQLVNSLEETFGDGSFSVVGPPEFIGGAPAINNFNPDYDGDNQGVLGLLGPGVTLTPGESGTIQITVDVNRDSPTLQPEPDGSFLNQTEATGIGATSETEVSDLSDDFNTIDPEPPTLVDGIDPDGDGNAGGTDPQNPENTPTPVTFVDPTVPQIGVSKQVVSSTLIPDGAFGVNTARVVYEIVVENIGPEDLDDVQLTESLEDTFGDGNFQLVESPQFTGGNPNLDAVNPNFDGDNQGDLNLLDPANLERTLPEGASSTFQVTVDVDIASDTLPDTPPGPFENQVVATGVGTDSGVNTTDLSNDATSVTPGQDPIDPNDNGLANEDGENVPTPVFLGADIRLTKRITQVLRNGQPLFVPQINQFNDQDGDDSDNLLQTLSNNALPPGLFNAPDLLQSGDTVEYTVYFFNAGAAPVQNLELCDVLRVPNVLQTGSLELAPPSTTPPTEGSFVPSPLIEARAPLAPLDASCEDVTGTGNFPPGPDDQVIPGAGGGVVVGATDGDAPSGLDLGANEIGAFRFQVIVP